MINKAVFALTIILAALSIQACDDGGSGGSERVDLRCGDVLTASLIRSGASDSRNFVAVDDVLSCSGTAVTLVGPETLDLNGKSISCDGSAGTIGIQIKGNEATVRNGVVKNCEAGVVIEGGGMHTIKNVEASDNFGEKDVELAGGFVVLSDHNTLNMVKASGNSPVGMQIVGDGNVVRDSEVSENGHMGIVIFGDSNEVSESQASNNNYVNIAVVKVIANQPVEGGSNNMISNVTANHNNLSHGIYIGGDSNTVSGNEASSNEISGIRVDGTNNDLRDNVALGNNESIKTGIDRDGKDLSDPHPDCVNTWQINEFVSSDSPCIQ